eukprot:SAG22_NODE_844_length_6872_cov_10.004577_9_plen_146_part_00
MFQLSFYLRQCLSVRSVRLDSWTQYKWGVLESPRRLMGMLWLLLVLMAVNVNSFALKSVFEWKTGFWINLVRLCGECGSAVNAARPSSPLAAFPGVSSPGHSLRFFSLPSRSAVANKQGWHCCRSRLCSSSTTSRTTQARSGSVG